MSRWRLWWAAAGGQAPPRELVEASKGLTWGRRRAAGRAVRRGEACDDPALARLAVAQARMALRRHPSTGLHVFFAVMVLGWAAFAIGGFAGGRIGIGAFFAATTLFGIWALWRLRPRALAHAREAERLNREVLAQAGEPFREDAEAAAPVTVPAAALALATVVLWLFYDVFFGAMTRWMDGASFDLPRAMAHGAVFATLMIVANATWMRRRTERQSRRPVA